MAILHGKLGNVTMWMTDTCLFRVASKQETLVWGFEAKASKYCGKFKEKARFETSHSEWTSFLWHEDVRG